MGVIPAFRVDGTEGAVRPSRRQERQRRLRMGRTWTLLIVVQVSVASVAFPMAVSLGCVSDARHTSACRRSRYRAVSVCEVGFALDRQAMVHAWISLDTVQGSRTSAALARAAPGRARRDRRIRSRTSLPEHRAARSAITFENDGDRLRSTSHALSSSRPSMTSFFKTFGRGAARRPRSSSRADLDENAPTMWSSSIVHSLTGRASGGAVLGRRIRYVPEGPDTDSAPVRWHRIVGVVENIDENPLSRKLVDARVYHPLKAGRSRVGLAVRVGGTDLGAFGRRVREVAVSVDPALEVEVEPLRQYYQFVRTLLTNAAIGLGATLLSVLLLAAAGIYALMSFTVARRRHESRSAPRSARNRGVCSAASSARRSGRSHSASRSASRWRSSSTTRLAAKRSAGRDWLLLTGTSVLMGWSACSQRGGRRDAGSRSSRSKHFEGNKDLSLRATLERCRVSLSSSSRTRGAAQVRRLDLDVLHLVDRAGEDVAVEHDEVGELAGLERSVLRSPGTSGRRC